MDGNWGKSSFSDSHACLEARWKTATFSGNGNCIESRWKKFSTTNGCVESRMKSSFSSQQGNCVDTSYELGVVQVRDSKNKTGDGKILEFTPAEWQTNVLTPVKRGVFDWSEFEPLIFTDEEKEAFVLGVRAGEFELPKVTA